MVGDEAGEERWTFTEEALARARESARERAVQALRLSAAEGGERRTGAREPPKPLSLEEGSRLVSFYAQKLPELCGLCGAPGEVRWTAVVFYRRFFAVRSPMEFDPLSMMFASVHVACKIEEVHEITLDKLLEAADFGADESLKAKVAGLELPLLEGIGFSLLVEPKPHPSLVMLAEEMQHFVAQRPASCRSPPPPALAESAWAEAVERAEGLIVDLSVRTDAVLRWPASAIIAAALAAALDAHFGQSVGNSGNAWGLSGVLGSVLDAHLEAESQRVAVRGMVEEVQHSIRQRDSDGEVAEDAVKEAARSARRCLRAFERLREEATERHEAHRKERKRRWTEMKGAARRQVPTPILQDLADLNRKAAALQGAIFPGDGLEDFVIRRPKEDVEDD